jgi:hypothetical protein
VGAAVSSAVGDGAAVQRGRGGATSTVGGKWADELSNVSKLRHPLGPVCFSYKQSGLKRIGRED